MSNQALPLAPPAPLRGSPSLMRGNPCDPWLKTPSVLGKRGRPSRAGFTTDFTDQTDRENDRLQPGLKQLNSATGQDPSSKRPWPQKCTGGT